MSRQRLLDFNYEGPDKVESVPKKSKRIKEQSRFGVIINTNISGKQWSGFSKEKREEIMDTFDKAVDVWLKNIKKFMFCDDPQSCLTSEDCRIVRSEFEYELGGGKDAKTRNKSGLLHKDGIIEFAGYCKFNLNKCKEWFTKALKKYVKGQVRFTAKFIPDNLERRKRYNKKEQQGAGLGLEPEEEQMYFIDDE